MIRDSVLIDRVCGWNPDIAGKLVRRNIRSVTRQEDRNVEINDVDLRYAPEFGKLGCYPDRLKGLSVGKHNDLVRTKSQAGERKQRNKQ